MASSVPTVSRLDYTPVLKLLDFLVRLTESVGLPLTRLEVDSILSASRRRTGLTDWGDEAFIERMRFLLVEINQAGFAPLGRAFMRASAITAVRNRLQIEAYIGLHPEIESRPIEKPIFIVGFPRTGTTLVQNLLTLDDRNRALEFWELTQVVPVSSDRAIDRRKRMEAARLMLRLAYWAAPEMRTIHEVDVHSPEECWYLFQNIFAVLNNDLMSGVESIGDRLLESDMVGPYREYRRMLQLLSEGAEFDRYVLKCPEHLWFIEDLLEVFPDACIVWTHRDPVSSVASYSSLISLQWRVLYGRIDPTVIGSHIANRFVQGVERAMATRDAVGDENRFFDVDFRELTADPAGMIRRIQEHFDLPRPAETDAAVQAYLENGRHDKAGAHHYSFEQFGLDPTALRTRFVPYIERFGLD